MNAAAQAAMPTKKKGPDLSKVTPEGAYADPPEWDTTTPIDTSVDRFDNRMLPKRGAWLLSRMQPFWPGFNQMNYAGLLFMQMHDNGSLFIRSKRAIMLAVCSNETFEPRPTVDVVFLFKFHPNDEAQDKDALLLWRRAEEWAKGMGGRQLRVLHPDRVDVAMGRLKQWSDGDQPKALVKDLDK